MKQDFWTWSPVARMRDALAGRAEFGSGVVHIARAPGRLDVMGGIADYSGSLVCEMPLRHAAGAAVQARTDRRIVCVSAQAGKPIVIDAGLTHEADPLVLRKALEAAGGKWAGYVIGCVWWLNTHGHASIDGMTIYVDSDVPLGGGVSSSAAIEVATMSALTAAVDVKLSPLELAAACQAVENRVVGAPCGVMDQVTSSMGQAGAMLKILCQPGPDGLPAQVLGPVAVPHGYRFVGIHSGVSHDVSGDPYTDTRVAAFIGQMMLSQLETSDVTHGWLARVDAEHYRHNLRQSLPGSMTGDAFIRQYERTNDPITTIDADKEYQVRAATDHHVYEMSRVTRFVRLIETSGDMRAAGELMYESHRSYSECANLGHAMTDRLVAMVRERGPSKGLFGAKITGGGSGGTVAILAKDDDATSQVIADIRLAYEKETGHRTTYFEGTSPGAAAMGTATFQLGTR